MRLLVLTQKVDEGDDVLGFFHEWLRRFAARVESVEVVCLVEGAHTLPSNVRVYSLGKPADAKAMAGAGARLVYSIKLYQYLWHLRGRYDAVFVHMNPEYVVLAGWLWRLIGKRIVLWYSHRNVDLKLRIAERFADVIASGAASSFRLHTSKLRVLGHGIDTDYFKPVGTASLHQPLKLVSVGRITPIKRLEVAVDALALLHKAGVAAELTLVGAPGPSDEAYAEALKVRIAKAGLASAVIFAGSVPYKQIARYYQDSDFSINLAPTGGLDKAVFEAMACGLPVLVSNQGFTEYMGMYRDRLLFVQDDAGDLAAKLEMLYREKDGKTIGAYLRDTVEIRASLDRLLDALLGLLYAPQ